jgi:hypothetical protein
MKKIMPFVLCIMLAGCATTNNIPTGEKCIIPDALMVKAPRLPVLIPDKNGKATLDYLFNTWLDDISKYNNLKTKDDALVDWTVKYCTAKPLSSTTVTPQPSNATPPANKQPSLFGD